MNFNAKLVQYPRRTLQPAIIREMCQALSAGLDLIGSPEDKDTFRKLIRKGLGTLGREDVRYAVQMMQGRYVGDFNKVCDRVANAWISEILRDPSKMQSLVMV